MSRYVTVDSGTYFSTPDAINLLDGDSSHLAQSVGQWVKGSSATGEYVSNGGDYGKLTQTIANAGTAERWNIINQIAGYCDLAAGTTTVSATVNNKQSTSREMYFKLYLSGSGQANETATLEPGTTRVSASWVHAGGFLSHLWMVPDGVSLQNGDEFEFSKIMVVDGTETSFQPSLRIVANDTYTKSPAAVTAAFTKGASLTVGVAWAGDAGSVRLQDGVGGPTVAAFSAAAPSTVGNTDTWVDVTGRTWTVNGTGATLGYIHPPPATVGQMLRTGG